jgi:hypothetical protein
LRHRFHEFESHPNQMRSIPAMASDSRRNLEGLTSVGAQDGSKKIASQERAGFLGLKLSPDHPHAVLEVDDLVDVNSVRQGQPGYMNEGVGVGDVLLKIDDRDVSNLSFEDLHSLLRGEIHTVVQITLRRRQTGAVYTVRVLRHRFHEFESHPNQMRSIPAMANKSHGHQVFAHVGRPEGHYAGLEVTERPPHQVVAVDDLVDSNFLTQGQNGYSNPSVSIGDRILAVDGRPAEYVSVGELHGTTTYSGCRAALVLLVVLLLRCRWRV